MNSLPPTAPQTSTPTPQLGTALADWLTHTLATQGWSRDAINRANVSALQTEASFRQFYRVAGPTSSVVLMDSPPAKERNAEFVSIATALAQAQVRVPEVLAHNESKGWLLLSDLGETHFIDQYQAGNPTRCLDAALSTLEQIAPVRHPAIEPYTLARLNDELEIFTDWLVTAACEITVPEAVFAPARDLLLANASDQGEVCVHRDFHCKNLLLVDTVDTSGETAIETGVLDFQDALIGPNGYDLASLLHDCYWTFDDHTIDSVIDRVAGVTRRSVDLLAIQRQLKAIGIFARLALRDSKTSHLRHIGPVIRSLVSLCYRYPELLALGEWLEKSLHDPALQWLAARHSTHTTTDQ